MWKTWFSGFFALLVIENVEFMNKLPLWSEYNFCTVVGSHEFDFVTFIFRSDNPEILYGDAGY